MKSIRNPERPLPQIARCLFSSLTESENQSPSAERAEIVHFVESMIPQLISSTPFFMLAIERALRTRLRITGGSDSCWTADFRSGKCELKRSDSDNWDDSVWIAESAFLRLIQAKIPLGHTWG